MVQPSFLLIDKASGQNSFRLVQCLRKIFDLRRVGFAGTLDPLATGLLIFALAEATKLLPALEGMDKVYEVKIRLGKISTTYDAEGEISDYPTVENFPTHEFIEEVLKSFLGSQQQMPPQFSAIKIKGKHAYEMARKGVKVDLKPRPVVFYDIRLDSYEYPMLALTVHCSSGTYIRSLAHDLGQKLQCGGHVEELRRTKVGPFSVKDAIDLNIINPSNKLQYVLKPQELLKDWAQIELTEKEYAMIALGGFIPNRIHYQGKSLLALYQQECVGLIETFNEGASLKFIKKFTILDNAYAKSR